MEHKRVFFGKKPKAFELEPVEHDYYKGDSLIESNGIIEVFGNVPSNTIILAKGGGAKVIIHGDVEPGATIGAEGGSASVIIYGRVYN